MLQEQEQLEKKQFELFGINIPEQTMRKQIEDATSFWLQPQALLNLINTYLEKYKNKETFNFTGGDVIMSARISVDGRKKMLSDFLQIPQSKNAMYAQWETWLRSDNPNIKICFDAQVAANNEHVFFITPMHPLIIQASKNVRYATNSYITVTCSAQFNLPAGEYSFGIFQWNYTGIKNNNELVPICSNPLLNKLLFKLLETASNYQTNTMPDIVLLENVHYSIWETAKKEHTEATSQIISFKKESLQSSHRARLALLNEQLLQAKNEKIKKMRTAQIANAITDFNFRTAQLEEAAKATDILARKIIFGVLTIKN